MKNPSPKQVWLILGGTRSGKSSYAQRLAETLWKKPLYLAAAEITDQEMADRVRRHRKARCAAWLCAEEPLEVGRILAKPPARADGILFDCVTIWLSNVMVKEGVTAMPRREKGLLRALQQSPRDVILVSNEVGLGIVPESKMGRTFRDRAGLLNQALAKAADHVILIAAGLPLVLKGRLPETS